MTAPTCRGRVASALAAVVLLTVTGGANASKASSSQSRDRASRVILGATNVLTGNQTGAISVTLPRPATIADPDFRENDLEVRGKGRFVGFALFQDEPGDRQVGLFGGRPPLKSRIPPVLLPHGLDSSKSVWRLPAGDYTLYLLADGHKATVSVKLHGLSGTRRLEPSDPVQYSVASPKPDYTSSVAPGEPRNLYSAGADRELGGTGYVFDALWELHEAHAATEFMTCLYEGKPEGPAPYAPGCPNPSNNDRFIYDSTAIAPQADQGGWAFYGGGILSPGGRYGMGGSITSAAAVYEAGYVAVWLTLDD